jgi:hypothetical protein
MPQRRKSKMSKRKYNSMKQKKNKRTRKFRKSRKQYGGMTLVPFNELQAGTLYYIESKMPKREAKRVRQGQPIPTKIQKQKGVFQEYRNNLALFNQIENINPQDDWSPANGPRFLYSEESYNFYLPTNEEMMLGQVLRQKVGDPNFRWNPNDTNPFVSPFADEVD